MPLFVYILTYGQCFPFLLSNLLKILFIYSFSDLFDYSFILIIKIERMNEFI